MRKASKNKYKFRQIAVIFQVGFVSFSVCSPDFSPHHVGADDSVGPICAPVKKRKRTFETRSASRAAIASEEASSIPFPPGRRKLHIRWLLLPFQTVTVSLGHNLAIWNFTTPHAILMMAVRNILRIQFVGGGQYEKAPGSWSIRALVLLGNYFFMETAFLAFSTMPSAVMP